MNTIDWRAFWVSGATIILFLAIFFILVHPLIKKYKVEIVGDDDKDPSVKKVA